MSAWADGNPRVRALLRRIDQRFGLKPADLRSPVRTQQVTYARRLFYFAMHRWGFSYPECADALDFAHHQPARDAYLTITRDLAKAPPDPMLVADVAFVLYEPRAVAGETDEDFLLRLREEPFDVALVSLQTRLALARGLTGTSV